MAVVYIVLTRLLHKKYLINKIIVRFLEFHVDSDDKL